MKIIIRQETEKDYAETEAMTRRAFWNKFGPGCNEHLLVHTLRENPAYLKEYSRVAEIGGHIAGVITYFRAVIHTAGGDIPVASFGPLCADHRYKNCGVGSTLLRETLPLVKAAGYPGVLIFGEPEYYPKHGFVRAGSLGLTDMNGSVSDPFMAYELVPGGLHIPGGRFDENAFGIEDGLTDEALARLEEERHFEYLAKAVRPCQWGYDNARDEKDGYHLMYAVQAPDPFDAMFRQYVAELSLYDESLKTHDIGEMTRELRENVCKTRYLIMAGSEPAGLLVTSVPETAEEAEADGCGSYLEEIWVRPEYRRRGIARNIFLRYLRLQTTDTGFCVIPSNPAKQLWLGLLDAEGFRYTSGEGEEGLLFCRVHSKRA